MDWELVAEVSSEGGLGANGLPKELCSVDLDRNALLDWACPAVGWAEKMFPVAG